MKKCCSDELINECQSSLEGEFFKAFVDDSRLKILLLLIEHGEMTVNGVTEQVHINQSNVSRHLSLLKRAGVVISERKGRETVYRPDYKNIAYRLQSLANVIQQCCPPNRKDEQ